MQQECRIYQVALKVMRVIYRYSLKMIQTSYLTSRLITLKRFTHDQSQTEDLSNSGQFLMNISQRYCSTVEQMV
ncbi:hypothetical protein SPV-80A_gp63 [Staphylococcus phage 80alpha]|uniref:Uncharacterized protein n=3 Tax=Dubowvirus TaxID=2842658 RepID=A4ZFC9_BP80A|nr:hypothetical protein SPV-80A_gp63 [Staphylococcus phage 80alpha]AAX90884.1 ORF070 [Staphylococcus phage 53]AAX90966.1 ORF072 [Staphylococcus phage 85]ABF71634.1 hypothetical protein [Staphylococcus phage 80alpha]